MQIFLKKNFYKIILSTMAHNFQFVEKIFLAKFFTKICIFEKYFVPL